FDVTLVSERAAERALRRRGRRVRGHGLAVGGRGSIQIARVVEGVAEIDAGVFPPGPQRQCSTVASDGVRVSLTLGERVAQVVVDLRRARRSGEKTPIAG